MVIHVNVEITVTNVIPGQKTQATSYSSPRFAPLTKLIDIQLMQNSVASTLPIL